MDLFSFFEKPQILAFDFLLSPMIPSYIALISTYCYDQGAIVNNLEETVAIILGKIKLFKIKLSLNLFFSN